MTKANTPNRLKLAAGLTPKQWDILKHRLEVPDAISDCLPQYDADDVGAICDLLERGDLDGANDMSERITADVLEDAVTGSTYLAATISGYDGTTSERNQALLEANTLLAGQTLAQKIGNLIGRPLRYPTR